MAPMSLMVRHLRPGIRCRQRHRSQSLQRMSQDGDGMNGSFVSELYDTCESKSRVKNGELSWKPQHERGDGNGILFS